MRLLPVLRPAPTGSDPRRPDAVPGRPAAWVRRFRRHRHLLAALLTGIVVWSVVATVSPPEPSTSRVVVATRDLAAGTLVQPADVTTTDRATALVSTDGASALTTVVGRTVVSPVHAGEILRARDVLDAPLLHDLGAGVVATPLRVSDGGAVALLRAGDRVDVIAAGESNGAPTASVVASGVRVLVVPARGTGGDGGLFGSSADVTGSDGLLVVLATTMPQAIEIARASLRGRLSFVLRSG